VRAIHRKHAGLNGLVNQDLQILNTLPVTGVNTYVYTIFIINTVSVGITPPHAIKSPILFIALKTLRTSLREKSLGKTSCTYFATGKSVTITIAYIKCGTWRWVGDTIQRNKYNCNQITQIINNKNRLWNHAQLFLSQWIANVQNKMAAAAYKC
jgi:hypothetical protein